MTALTEFAQSPQELTFKLLVQAWNKLKTDRIDDLRRLAPNMTSLDKVYIRKLSEEPQSLTVEFVGLDTAALDSTRAAEVRRMIEIWLQRVSASVQKMRNTSTTLTVRLDKELRVGHIDMTRTAKGPEKMSPPAQTESKYERTPNGVTKIIIERGR